MPTSPVMSRRGGYEVEDEEEYLKPILPTVPEKCGPPTIELGRLVEFAVLQILHELTVLSELLPKKLDADRKISIVQFAHSTRTLFIKLLAVVKWVKSSKKFDSCASICYFLDQQSSYFVDTAERLLALSREDLVSARLPAFQVPAAIDVFTLGTYPRLPLCIKSRFIPEPLITAREQACVLARLNQVIQTRLSKASAKLSPRIRSVIIKNGMVTMRVPGEFEVSLTLLGERAATKWTLLNIRILVEDYEIGFGTKLVHPLQVNIIHNVLQARMDVSPEPLGEVYSLLHTFAQSLQLDVLYCQAAQLVRSSVRHYAFIEQYDIADRVLSISYWLRRSHHNKYLSQYRFQIFSDIGSGNLHSGLKIRHFPVGKGLPQVDDRTGRLSIGRILSETVAVRCRERLLRLRERLELVKPRTVALLTGRATPSLTYALVGDHSRTDEKLLFSVNSFSGNILAVVTSLGNRQELRDLEQMLNDASTQGSISDILARLRILLVMERYRKAVASLPVRIVSESVLPTRLTALRSIPPDRICLQFIKEDFYYLVVSFAPNDEVGVSIGMYLLSVLDSKTNMVLLNPSQMIASLPLSSFFADRALNVPPLAKKQRWLGNTKQLAFAVSTIDDRLAFMRICEELGRRNVKFEPITTEGTVGGLLLRINDFSGAIPCKSTELFASMVNCCLRLDTRSRVIWPFECTLTNTPLIPDFYEQKTRPYSTPRRTKTTVMEINSNGITSCVNTSESVSTHMIDRLVVFAHMYEPVREFADNYYRHFYKFCNIAAFTYHKLVIAYGERRNQLMILTWKQQKNAEPRQYFYLTFGIGPNREIANGDQLSILPQTPTLWNAHILMWQRLQKKFNEHQSLSELVQYLIETVEPLSCLNAFTRVRLHSLRSYSQMLSLDCSLPVTMQTSLVVVNEQTVRLICGAVQLEFVFLGGSRVAVRDCARIPSAYRLRAFCSQFTCHELLSSHDSRSPAAPSWLRSPSGPGSLPALPPHQMGCSPATRVAASPMSSHLSLSVPPADVDSSPLRYKSMDTYTAFSRASIFVDHLALRKMTSYGENGVCPLEEYLFALSYLSRLGPALEGYRQDHRGSGAHPVVQFRSLRISPESVRMSVIGAAPQTLKHEPFVVNFNIHLDEETMSLKLKLDFEGDDVPLDSDVRIAERYFEKCVAPLGNELAVVAFANACRLTVPGTFSAIAQLMAKQMEWTEDTRWRPSMQLVMWSSEGSTQRARISPGIVIDQTNVSVLILLCLRPTRSDPSEKNADASKHLLPLIYNTQTNSVARRGGVADDEPNGASAILSYVSEQYSRSSERALWPAVRALAHKFLQPSSTPHSVI